MDIRAGTSYPAGKLSNLPRRHFVLDEVECCSAEGWLQGLKFRDPEMQEVVCTLVGVEAKATGRQIDWRRNQTLYWRGVPISRHAVEYQDLLDRGFEAMARQSREFRDALLATGDVPLTHTIGGRDPHETILTEAEFVARLVSLRDRLKRGEL